MAEADVNGAVKFATTTPDVTVDLSVVNGHGVAVPAVRAVLSDFVDERMQTARPSGWPPAPFQVGAAASMPLRITVRLPGPGEYGAKLWLVNADGATAPTVIRIAYAVSKADLLIGNPTPALVELEPFSNGSVIASSSLTMVEIKGGQANVRAPVLLSPLYRPNEKTTIAAPGLRLVDPRPLALAAEHATSMPLAFTGFASAGRYEAAVAVSHAASDPVTRTVAIYVREPVWVAVCWIVAGVLLSFVLRYYAGVLAPRLTQQARVAALFQQLDALRATAGQDEAARAVVDAVDDRLTERWNTLAAGAKAVDTTDLDVYEAKLPVLANWLRLRRFVEPWRPPKTRALASQVLDAAQAMLVNPAATAADVVAQATALAALPGHADAQTLDELRTVAQALEQELAGKHGAEQADLHRRAQALAAESSGAAAVADYARRLDALRRDVMALLAVRLKGYLAASPPPGIDAGRWQRIGAEANSHLDDMAHAADAEMQQRTWSRALRSYAQPVAEALADEAAQHAGPAWQRMANAAQAALQALQAELPALTLAGVERLRQLGEDLRQSPTPGVPVAQPRAMPMAMPLDLAGGLGATATGGLSDLAGAARGASGLRTPTAFGALMRKRRLLAIAAFAVVAVLTVLFGVKALYVDDWAWGGGSAYLVALLWGAGLFGFTYDGAKNVLTRFFG